MDWTLEVVPVPVSDVDRAKHFYNEQVGFLVDLDTQLGDERRFVQLTPPGSGCSIQLSSGILNTQAGPVQHMDDGEWIEGRGGDWNSFVFFSDPDGNGWVLQERPASD